MLGKAQIQQLFVELDVELEKLSAVGELYIVGGAVMALVFNARPATADIDAYFEPTAQIRKAAAKVAARHDLDPSWLNDAVKGFLSEHGSFAPYWNGNHLRVFTAQPEYLLAMKCLSMRLGPEFHDEADVRFLLRYLNVETYDQAVATIQRYYPRERFPQKALSALAEILPESAHPPF